MASVGPLLVWGWCDVGQDVPGSAFERPTQRMSSVRPLGTRVEVSVLIAASIRALPRILLGSR